MLEQKTTVKKLNKKCLTVFVLIIVSSLFCFVFLKKGLNNKQKTVFLHNNIPNINYKVYLKENNFFSTPYLEMGKTYIASLIDYIDIDFNNEQNFSFPVTGEYTYFIRGTISANKNNNKETNYWTKSYILSEPVTVQLSDNVNFNLKANVKVDYAKYSNLLREFRNEYGLPVDGNFKVELIIQTKGKTEVITNDLDLYSKCSLDIPLTEKAIELSFISNDKDNQTKIVEEKKVITEKHKIYFLMGIISFIVLFISCIYIIKRAIFLHKGRTKYHKDLKKILTTYDSIIVNVKNVPNTENIELINVNSFQELLDAHSEVRMPINYIELQHNIKSEFILINNNMGWIYVLEDDSYKRL